MAPSMGPDTIFDVGMRPAVAVVVAFVAEGGRGGAATFALEAGELEHNVLDLHITLIKTINEIIKALN